MYMNTKAKVVISVTAITSTLVGIALATPILDLTAPVLATGNDDSNIETHGVFATSEGEFKAKLYTEGPSTIFVQDVAYSPGGHTGWHQHPGVLTVALIAGTVKWYDGNCKGTVYTAGDAWTEGSQIHDVVSIGTVSAHFMVTYVIAKGAASRIDEPAPACATSLGLE
jgi:quercetin dioxygenase-like cupin family protein